MYEQKSCAGSQNTFVSQEFETFPKIAGPTHKGFLMGETEWDTKGKNVDKIEKIANISDISVRLASSETKR